MADATLWTDKNAKADFLARAQARLEALGAEMAGRTGVIAVEPDSGDFFVGDTLGKANALAYARHPDKWVYFARLDALDAAIALPTW